MRSKAGQGHRKGVMPMSGMIDSGKLTGNLKSGPLTRTVVYKGPLFRFHDNFPE